MDLRALLLAIVVILTLTKSAFTQLTSTTAFPLEPWKQAFVQQVKWSGYYVYNNIHVPCKLSVHSVSGIVLATFKDEEAEFDVHGTSEDGQIITFNMTTANTLSKRIHIDSEFQLHGRLTKDKRDTPFWTYHGNISVVATDENFGEFVMFAGDVSVVDSGGGFEDSRRVALTVGISLGAAVLGVIILVGIAVWAVKSGHLRHVPMSYKNFKNDASYDNTESTVHI